MVETSARAAPTGAPPSRGRQSPAPLPVRSGTGRSLVLLGAFICAACGLVYELELVAIATYLTGDSVTQTSVVLSVMVFAMGIGSLAAKRLRCRAAAGFGAIEAVLALVGGCSAMALYAVFVWTGGLGGAWSGGPRYLLVAFALLIGVLIGAEVPLLMVLIQRIRRQDAGGAVADLFAADYVGALIGGLAFPFLLLPLCGQLTGALVTGAVNALTGTALVFGLFRRDLSVRSRRGLIAVNAAVLGVLATGIVLVDDFEQAAREALYGPDVRAVVRTDEQEIVLTGGSNGSLDLYFDGRLQMSSRDERRYHDALVHPAMNGPHARVLILGGGDGLAAREVLRHPGVQRVDVVELDSGVVRLARTDAALSALNGHVYRDPRVHVIDGGAFRRLRGMDRTYDVVISDLPDPALTRSAKLYSQEFYGLASRLLAEEGRLVVHAGSADSRPRVFWTVETTVRAAGLRTTPYRVEGRLTRSAAAFESASGGSPAPHDWSFVLAGRTRPGLALDPSAPRPDSLTQAVLDAGARELGRTRVDGLRPSTLVHPRYGAGS
ncbi:polyamine aminopropyltransferase [Streptomyces himalayensis]|uniref:Polyamine aminopropyltransferase n=1 Tax=Streptomyces himalayensis subsp. himalayensis TaxID=2756131 RepID=A0A7W0DHI3_9ACTN|nr:polyamine aminopropyltransferase [Streptomyces himalayensis]MBA2945162.1 polyamine aminopropyltransferase [Streptomyces himalayensis subsp. himalayensis]